MRKVDKLLRETYMYLEQGAEEMDVPGDMGGGQPDIAEPQPGGDQAQPDQKPAPLTTKGEEYLLKLAYLALLYTPKDDEMMQVKNTFEASGIHDETAIRAEEPQTIADTKNILVNILGPNNTTAIADDLNEIPAND